VSVCIGDQETIDTSPVSRSVELTIFDDVQLFYRIGRSFLHGPVIGRDRMEYLHHTGHFNFAQRGHYYLTLTFEYTFLTNGEISCTIDIVIRVS